MYMYYIEELSIFVWLFYYINYVFFLWLEVLLFISNTISDGFSIKLIKNFSNNDGKPEDSA